MASFDIKIILTNVLLREVINTCTNNSYKLYKPTISKENVVK